MMKTEILDPDPENNSETCCKSCGDEYELRDGCEPTKYCDLCAHKVVERLENELNDAKTKMLTAIFEFKRVMNQRDELASTLKIFASGKSWQTLHGTSCWHTTQELPQQVASEALEKLKASADSTLHFNGCKCPQCESYRFGLKIIMQHDAPDSLYKPCNPMQTSEIPHPWDRAVD